MAGLGAFPCPRCGGPIRATVVKIYQPRLGLMLTLDPFAVRRHSICFSGSNGGGEPLSVPIAA